MPGFFIMIFLISIHVLREEDDRVAAKGKRKNKISIHVLREEDDVLCGN